MAVLSEMDGQALCYPAFLLVGRLRKPYKDGAESRSAAPETGGLVLTMDRQPSAVLTHVFAIPTTP